MLFQVSTDHVLLSESRARHIQIMPASCALFTLKFKTEEDQKIIMMTLHPLVRKGSPIDKYMCKLQPVSQAFILLAGDNVWLLQYQLYFSLNSLSHN